MVGEVSLQTKKNIATLLHCDKRTISFFSHMFNSKLTMPVVNSALAFAYFLCEGINPSKVAYQFKEFCQNFLSCLQ